MCWNHYYFKCSFMLFALCGFILFIFKKRHGSFVYLFSIIFCLCVYIYRCIFFSYVLYHFYCVMFIVYVHAFRHRNVFCFAFICLHIFLLLGLNSLGVTVNIHTWARVRVDAIDTNKDVVENAHMGRGGAYRVQYFYMKMVCEYS